MMKKLICYLSLAALPLLFACTADDSLSMDSIDDELLNVSIAPGDVPIRLGVFNGSTDGDVTPTRASINGTANLSFDSVGIFCLARQRIGTNTYKPSWQGNGSDKFNKLAIWQRNVLAHSDASMMKWPDDAGEHFYPYSQWFAYDFAAYHPYTDSISTTWKKTKVWVTIDGNDDLIYALASREAADGYSATFYQNGGTEIPVFHFKHLLCRLKFVVRLASEPTQEYRVDSIYLENMPTVMGVVIATLDPDNETISAGGLEVDYQTDKNKFGPLWLRDIDDTSIKDKQDGEGNWKYGLSTEPKQIGDAIMMPPVPYAPWSTLKLHIVLKDNDGATYTSDDPILVTPPTGGWTAAKSYRIPIKITNPTKIQASAHAFDWVEDETSIGEQTF